MDKFKIGDRIVVSATHVAEEFRGSTGTVVEINDEDGDVSLIGFTLDDDTERGFVWRLLSCHLDHYYPFNENPSIGKFINEF